MSDAQYSSLVPYGWDDEEQARYEASSGPGTIPGRVVRVDRGRCEVVLAGDGDVRLASIEIPATAAEQPCTGDWVAVSTNDTLTAVLPRRTAIVRASASRRSDGQVLAANIDTVLIAVSMTVEPDLARIERFLSIAWESGAQPLLVLTKSDAAGVDAAEMMDAVAAVAPGVDVLAVSAVTGDGVDVLTACLGFTTALLGQSGAGKSTLVNALLGEQQQAVRETRQDGKGRHTTTTRELILIPGAGVLIDTPGLRGVGMHDAAEGVKQTFADIEDLAAGCRFGDCGHAGEPGCAVQAAIAGGTLSERRLSSYRKLLRENAWEASRNDPRLRAEHDKYWKQMAHEGNAAAALKGRR
nr:ribosome small subunit-dependent GTPase A [uncultured Actinoplanes sp.]